MNFHERNLENNIASTKKDIREANDELLNAANSFAADVLKKKINTLTLKLHKCLDDLKSINPNNSLLNAEDGSLVPDDYEEYLKNYVKDLVALRTNYKTENADEFILDDDEEMLFCVNDIVLSEQKSIRTPGAYHGMSVRIMPGLWYRVGQGTGHSEVRITPIDTGTFALTTKRIFFSGEFKSISYDIESLVSIKAFEEGFGLGRSKKQNTEYFSNFNNWIIEPENYQFNGGFMKNLIMETIKQKKQGNYENIGDLEPESEVDEDTVEALERKKEISDRWDALNKEWVDLKAKIELNKKGLIESINKIDIENFNFEFKQSNGDIDKFKYDGQWKDGKPNGFGKLITQDSNVLYEGYFKDGMYHGNGRHFRRDTDNYFEGEYSNDSLKKGIWMFHEEDLGDGPAFYVGEIENQLPWGQGKMITEVGSYEGVWKGKVVTKGTLVNEDFIYEGGFHETIAWKMEGFGKIINSDGLIFEGKFKDSEPVEGKMTTNDGTVFEGKFEDWTIVEGKMTTNNGTVFEGKFEDSEPVKGKMTNSNGDVLEGRFEDGVFIE